MDTAGLRLGFFVVFTLLGGAHHTFLTPTLVAAIAMSQSVSTEAAWIIFAAWLLGIAFSSFMRH